MGGVQGWEDDDADILVRRKKARKKNDDKGCAEYPSFWWIDCWFLRKRNLPRRRGGSSDQCKSKSTKREEKRWLTRSTDGHYKEELTNP